MIITVSNTLTIDNPSAELLVWCSKHMRIANPEYQKKVRMNLWLGNTPKTLCLYEQRGTSIVLPFGTLRSLPESVRKNAVFMGDFKAAEEVSYGGVDIPLYDYQKAAVDAVAAGQYGILQSPAGSGKTQMGIALVKRFGKKALWLTHTLDLLRQSKERAELYMDKRVIGTITEGKVNIGSGITFATIQTMCKLNLAQYKDLWDTIIVDECHRCSGTPTAMTQFYKVLNSLSARHKIGLSATVHRSDGMIEATYALLGHVIYTVPDKAVGDKIMKVGILPVATGVELSRDCLNTDGTLNYMKMVTYLTENLRREEVIVNTIKLNEGKSCLILSDRLSHLEHLMNWLPAHMRRDAVMVSGKMTKRSERKPLRTCAQVGKSTCSQPTLWRKRGWTYPAWSGCSSPPLRRTTLS